MVLRYHQCRGLHLGPRHSPTDIFCGLPPHRGRSFSALEAPYVTQRSGPRLELTAVLAHTVWHPVAHHYSTVSLHSLRSPLGSPLRP